MFDRLSAMTCLWITSMSPSSPNLMLGNEASSPVAKDNEAIITTVKSEGGALHGLVPYAFYLRSNPTSTTFYNVLFHRQNLRAGPQNEQSHRQAAVLWGGLPSPHTVS